MALVCSISHEVPEHPVVSPSSNHVFEKRLIEKYIAENGVDPISQEPLTVEQLIDIKVTPLVKPRPPTATSIPAILKILQDEWDACMLHSFTLRQQLQTARQELSHALYQHDAACRVVARLTKEVTAAREALATLKPHAVPGMAPIPGALPPGAASQPPVPEPMEAAEGGPAGMTDEIIQKLQEKANLLTAERKKRGKNVPKELLPSDDIRVFKPKASHPGLHSASNPGILSLDLQAADTNKVLTGGADKNAVVFNKESEQVIAILKGHTKKVTNVIYHPTEDVVFTSSPDTSIRIWIVANASCTQTINAHDAPVTGLSLHATGDYLLSCSEDKHWAFSDIATGRVLTKVADESVSSALTCAQFHPDGLIFGTGTDDSIIKIWNLKERTNVANFPGHSGPITALAFSENGYYLATAADDAVIKLWDLRKLKNFKNISLDDRYENSVNVLKDAVPTCMSWGQNPILCVACEVLTFDQSGSYLAVAGSDVRVYLCKQWQELCVFSDHTDIATGVRFGNHASFLASTGMDRNLKFLDCETV